MAIPSTADSLKQVQEHTPTQTTEGSMTPHTPSNDPSTPSSSRPATRQGSPDSAFDEPLTQLSQQVTSFFGSVSSGGFPDPQPEKKAQPWKRVWRPGPQAPSEDGKLIVACPKICVYGSNNLGGL
ncbi:uncharacterized protein K444DRAFT_610091 [Hyaloscypha bicolor E]|uniref:Uncharacterized protein n=1 Tax=Hyaloscypha bicolor E TaxID=1095630 RepID=A0A2J6TJU0_9HELO|nr:uncharacterized protein K444DRAFT_610091 [Hyaloscypha bicolor E]PMD63258.1 hypothetical protein K444DRAFT_610091 [Hyaloscypha bicolor E]